MYEIAIVNLDSKPNHKLITGLDFNKARTEITKISKLFDSGSLIPAVHHVRICYRNYRGEPTGAVFMVIEKSGSYRLDSWGDSLASSIISDMKRLTRKANNRIAEYIIFTNETAFNSLANEVNKMGGNNNTPNLQLRTQGTRRGYQSVKTNCFAPYASNNGVGIIEYSNFSSSSRYKLARVYVLKNPSEFIKEWLK